MHVDCFDRFRTLEVEPSLYIFEHTALSYYFEHDSFAFKVGFLVCVRAESVLRVVSQLDVDGETGRANGGEMDSAASSVG
jgi:hypothetical protein